MMRKITCRLFICLFSLVFVLTFGFSQWKGEIKDENGIKVVKNPPDPLYGDIELDLEEDLVIESEKEGNIRFYMCGLCDVDNKGNIYILDRGEIRIQKFDSSGKYLSTIGRKGQAPGEFMNPLKMYLNETGYLYVKDDTRVHCFDPSGTFEKLFVIPSASYNYMITSDDNLLIKNYSYGPETREEVVVLTDSKGKSIKQIASFPSERLRAFSQEKTSLGLPELYLCPINKELAVFGFSDTYKLTLVNARGEIVSIIEKEERPIKISNREKNKIIDDAVVSIKNGPYNQNKSRQELEKGFRIPSKRPFFHEFLSDENGNIYVDRVISAISEDQRRVYDVFSREGHYLYRFRVPENTGRIYCVKNGHLYCRRNNSETGKQEIVRFKMKNQIKL